MTASVLTELAELRIIPVVEIVDAAHAVPLAEALTAAGLPAMEVTLRTRAALDAIAAISAALPDFHVGAGTLLAPKDVDAARRAGATFGVSPGFTPALSGAAARASLPFIPGAVTASEILAAAEFGHRELKFFPAERSGGVKTLQAFSSPFKPLGISFMPTGGVNPDNLRDYLALDSVFAVGGTWIAPRNLITEGSFDAIHAAAVDAVATSAEFRRVAAQ